MSTTEMSTSGREAYFDAVLKEIREARNRLTSLEATSLFFPLYIIWTAVLICARQYQCEVTLCVSFVLLVSSKDISLKLPILFRSFIYSILTSVLLCLGATMIIVLVNLLMLSLVNLLCPTILQLAIATIYYIFLLIVTCLIIHQRQRRQQHVNAQTKETIFTCIWLALLLLLIIDYLEPVYVTCYSIIKMLSMFIINAVMRTYNDLTIVWRSLELVCKYSMDFIAFTILMHTLILLGNNNQLFSHFLMCLYCNLCSGLVAYIIAVLLTLFNSDFFTSTAVCQTNYTLFNIVLFLTSLVIRILCLWWITIIYGYFLSLATSFLCIWSLKQTTAATISTLSQPESESEPEPEKERDQYKINMNTYKENMQKSWTEITKAVPNIRHAFIGAKCLVTSLPPFSYTGYFADDRIHINTGIEIMIILLRALYQGVFWDDSNAENLASKLMKALTNPNKSSQANPQQSLTVRKSSQIIPKVTEIGNVVQDLFLAIARFEKGEARQSIRKLINVASETKTLVADSALEELQFIKYAVSPITALKCKYEVVKVGIKHSFDRYIKPIYLVSLKDRYDEVRKAYKQNEDSNVILRLLRALKAGITLTKPPKEQPTLTKRLFDVIATGIVKRHETQLVVVGFTSLFIGIMTSVTSILREKRSMWFDLCLAVVEIVLGLAFIKLDNFVHSYKLKAENVESTAF